MNFIFIIDFIFNYLIFLGTMDFSTLSLHQTKRKEMDAQVKVLELEKALDQAKQLLYKLRKQHYQMAGEDAGWSQEVCHQFF
jgi:huntingtin interacting protein 1